MSRKNRKADYLTKTQFIEQMCNWSEKKWKWLIKFLNSLANNHY